VLQKLLDRGTLATVLVKKLGEKPSQEAFMQEYEKLARSLATNTLYE
jgi:carboxylate-amine ligase